MMYNYKIYAKKIDKPQESPKAENLFYITIILIIIGISTLFLESLNGWMLITLSTLTVLCILAIINIEDKNRNIDSLNKFIQTRAEKDQCELDSQAEILSEKLNNLLSKSHEISRDILPTLEAQASKIIELAKRDFADRAYSPFWSQIEEGSNVLAFYIDAINQLSTNNELYQSLLSQSLAGLRHTFPVSFPFSTEIGINETAAEYQRIIRKAHTDGTFSIIWEQRRNTQVVAGGFKTLESAILNMDATFQYAVEDLNISLSGSFDGLKFIQQQQIESYNASVNTLTQTLSIMDTKLYYIQWKRKPQDDFRHRY